MSGRDGDVAERRGRAVAALHARAAPELFEELCAAGGVAGDARERARSEWAALSAYACVRALVAAFGFGPDGARTVDAFHDAVFGPDEGDGRRARAAARYDAYGGVVRAAGTDDPAVLAARIGAAAAERMAEPGGAAALAELAGSLHEALCEAALDRARKE